MTGTWDHIAHLSDVIGIAGALFSLFAFLFARKLSDQLSRYNENRKQVQIMLINCIKGIDNGKFKLNTTKAKKARTDLSIELSKLLVNNRKIFTGKSGEALRNAMVEIAMPFDAIDYKNLKSDLIHLNSVLDNKGEVSLWKMIKEFLFRAKKHFAAK